MLELIKQSPWLKCFVLNRTDNADRRRQIIEESKYLGGDLEHTHLVKGLDYALLQKVKAELEKKEIELDEEEIQANLKKEEDDEDKPSDDEEAKPNLKPKIVTKTTTAAIAKSLNDHSVFKK